jgi:hypothetical protein
MDEMEFIREARRLYSIHSILGVDPRKEWLVCPMPQHIHHANTPSFSIYTAADGVQRFKCHGNCGLSGDVIDLVGYLYVPNYEKGSIEHVRRAITYLDRKYDLSPPEMKPKTPRLDPHEWRKYYPAERVVRAYAASRGLTNETLAKFKIGQYKHFMAMPTFEEGVLRMIKFRNTWPPERLDQGDFNSLRFWSAKGSVKGLFNYGAVAFTEQPVLILKGEIPVMLCDQYGLLACAPTGGESSLAKQYMPQLAFAEVRVVVGDNDPDPAVRAKMHKAAERRARVLKAELRYPPPEYKDIDEFILADPSAVEVIRSWLRSR